MRWVVAVCVWFGINLLIRVVDPNQNLTSSVPRMGCVCFVTTVAAEMVDDGRYRFIDRASSNRSIRGPVDSIQT